MFNLKTKAKNSRLIIAALFLTPVTLVGGCKTIDTVFLSQTESDEKALYTAEAAFNGVSVVILEATRQGLLVGSRAAEVQKYYRKAGDALSLARTAQQAGDAATVSEQAVLAQKAVAEAYERLR